MAHSRRLAVGTVGQMGGNTVRLGIGKLCLDEGCQQGWYGVGH